MTDAAVSKSIVYARYALALQAPERDGLFTVDGLLAVSADSGW